MSRQDANAAFARTSFLYGGNAPYLEDLYARYEADPRSVDAEWQAFFQSLKDDAARSGRRRAPPGSGRTGRARAQRARLCTRRRLARGRGALGDKSGARADKRRRALRRRCPAGHAQFDPRADADPRLPRARPFPRQSRSARPRAATGRGGARSALLRLHRRRHGPPDLPRQGARSRIRHAARDPRHPAAHLLPDARRRVHAHLRSGAEGLDAGAHRGAGQGDHVHAARASARSSTS